MRVLFSLFIFGLGLCVGSFINVVISRFADEKRDFWEGRSVCDHCGRQLKCWENIPLISFIFLKARCRTCQSPIPYQYPLVELTTGILFLIYSHQSLIINRQSFLIIISSLLLISLLIFVLFFDLKYMIIPDSAVLGLIILAGLINFLEITNYRLLITNYLLSAFLSTLFLLSLHLITKGKGMGLGDVKFSFFMGLLLGWPAIIFAFYLAFLTGAVIGVILILMGRKKFGQVVPFGPFLVLGTFIAWWWGDKLLTSLGSFLW